MNDFRIGAESYEDAAKRLVKQAQTPYYTSGAALVDEHRHLAAALEWALHEREIRGEEVVRLEKKCLSLEKAFDEVGEFAKAEGLRASKLQADSYKTFDAREKIYRGELAEGWLKRFMVAAQDYNDTILNVKNDMGDVEFYAVQAIGIFTTLIRLAKGEVDGLDVARPGE